MDFSQLTAQSLALAAKNVPLPGDERFAKAISVGSMPGGIPLIGYNLDRPAHQLVPLMAPFRNNIPRSVREGSNAINWKNITALSQPKFSTTENAAGALFTTTVVTKAATYVVHALQGKVTRESVAASQGFDPALQK